MNRSQQTEEKEAKCHFDMIRFIFEACHKLEAMPLTTATASCIYHQFCEEMPSCSIERQLVAAVSIYLAGKVEENHLKIRDVINVCHRMVHPKAEPLDLNVGYFDLRDSFIQLELLILRVLRFKVHFSHPHKYLLQYFWSLSHWMGTEIWRTTPVLRTSWAFIQDLLHSSQYLSFRPQHLAVGAIFLSFQVYGITVPSSQDAATTWYDALVDDLDEDGLWEIVAAIIKCYSQETVLRL